MEEATRISELERQKRRLASWEQKQPEWLEAMAPATIAKIKRNIDLLKTRGW